ncbi:MAG: type II secretion system protein [Leptospiraceae bacterium]|nr:type II secretion system protein [Leptospiraceae bacterium]
MIEMIIVTAVIGFLFSITAVSLKNFFAPTSQDTALTIQSVLKFGYNNALLNNKTVFFNLDFDKQEYYLTRVERDEEGIREEKISGIKKLPFNNKIYTAVDFSGKKISENTLKIPYTHDGTSLDFTLLVGEIGDIKKSIQIYRYGGKVRIENGENIRTSSKDLQKVDYGIDLREDDNSQNSLNKY